MSLRRFLIRHHRFRFRFGILLLAILCIGLLWGTVHSTTSDTGSPGSQEVGSQVEVDLLNPAIAGVFHAMLMEHLRQQKELQQQGEAIPFHPELDVRQARPPPQEQEAGIGRGARERNTAITKEERDYWAPHRQPPQVIPGTQSVVSINTTVKLHGIRRGGANIGGEYLHMLRALMFRVRPPDSDYNINASLSDRTPLDRVVPDSRQDGCKGIQHDLSGLPDVSVVIPFYNEPLSMLLRTMHSVINRSPPSLLREVVLVDDASTATDLGVPLEKYLSLVPKVLLVRNSVRLGLIKTRQLGVRLTSGEVLVFLDAHTEANVNWLPPLLDEIVKNRKTIVQPVVDNISPDTLKYGATRMDSFVRSSFTWDLRLVWTRLPAYEQARQEHPWSPFRTPVLVGCAIAVDRAFFKSIGGFDPEMNIWGGENFEVPFRTWMCGGQVLTVPCSRVGHTFRKLPYLNIGDAPKQIEGNLLRTAELWMGSYKGLAYGAISEEYRLNPGDFRSLWQRQSELEGLGLQCHNFDWFLQTLVPEVPLPPDGVELFGEVGNFRWTSCLAVISDNGALDLTVTCYMARMLPENYFLLDKQGRLVHAGTGRCVTYDKSTSLLYIRPCDGDTHTVARWEFRRTQTRAGMLVLPSGGRRQDLCLTQTGELPVGRRLLHMRGCRDNWTSQLWLWTYDFNLERVHDHSR